MKSLRLTDAIKNSQAPAPHDREPSARFLRENRFPDALYIVHGFQGDPAEEGAHAGHRIVNGWQNSGLPWERALDPSRIFRPKAHNTREWMVILSSGELETQAMAMILASAEIAQGTLVRILLCDQAGLLAIKGETAGDAILKPAGRSPRQMLQGLLNNGARVEVCGIFLRNRQGISGEDSNYAISSFGRYFGLLLYGYLPPDNIPFLPPNMAGWKHPGTTTG